jgi:hypothetical protein
MPRVGFESTSPVFERGKRFRALDRAATVVGTNNLKFKKTFWEELIAYYPLIRHELHRERRIKPVFYCCVFIRCSRNVFIKPLLSGIRVEYTDIWGKMVSFSQSKESMLEKSY